MPSPAHAVIFVKVIDGVPHTAVSHSIAGSRPESASGLCWIYTLASWVTQTSETPKFSEHHYSPWNIGVERFLRILLHEKNVCKIPYRGSLLRFEVTPASFRVALLTHAWDRGDPVGECEGKQREGGGEETHRETLGSGPTVL